MQAWYGQGSSCMSQELLVGPALGTQNVDVALRWVLLSQLGQSWHTGPWTVQTWTVHAAALVQIPVSSYTGSGHT
jgi:hypothetical protein